MMSSSRIDESPRDVAARWAAPLRSPVLQAQWELADAAGRARIDDALLWVAYGVAGPSLRPYPSPDVGATLILTGCSPRAVARGLTRREALQWVMQSDHATPGEWLWAQIVAQYDLPSTTRRPEWLRVIRWVGATLSSARRRPALLARLARLDEIEPCDLRVGVVETFERAEHRRRLAAWDGDDELIAPPPWAEQLPPGATLIITASGLLAEGREMRHCVGDYARHVHDGRAWILSLRGESERSTVEISPSDRRVRQHYGPGNSQPGPECQRLLSAVLSVVDRRL